MSNRNDHADLDYQFACLDAAIDRVDAAIDRVEDDGPLDTTIPEALRQIERILKLMAREGDR